MIKVEHVHLSWTNSVEWRTRKRGLVELGLGLLRLAATICCALRSAFLFTRPLVEYNRFRFIWVSLVRIALIDSSFT
jgi:hypothetical protein